MNRRTSNSDTQEQAVGATSVRPKRVPVGTRPRLHVSGKNPNFEYRWVNDTPNNINLMQQYGWQLCTNDEVDVGNFRTEQASGEGSLACTVVDGGNGMKAYVMKISKEEYKEIQDAFAEITDASEETLRPNYNDGEYGKISIDRSGRR
jgi:hypothetical protein